MPFLVFALIVMAAVVVVVALLYLIVGRCLR
jgi:hypothetical protein